MTAEIILGAAVCVLWAVFLILTAISIAITHKDTKKRTEEITSLSHAIYCTAYQLQKLNEAKKKEDPENEETDSTEQH